MHATQLQARNILPESVGCALAQAKAEMTQLGLAHHPLLRAFEQLSTPLTHIKLLKCFSNHIFFRYLPLDQLFNDVSICLIWDLQQRLGFPPNIKQMVIYPELIRELLCRGCLTRVSLKQLACASDPAKYVSDVSMLAGSVLSSSGRDFVFISYAESWAVSSCVLLAYRLVYQASADISLNGLLTLAAQLSKNGRLKQVDPLIEYSVKECLYAMDSASRLAAQTFRQLFPIMVAYEKQWRDVLKLIYDEKLLREGHDIVAILQQTYPDLDQPRALLFILMMLNTWFHLHSNRSDVVGIIMASLLRYQLFPLKDPTIFTAPTLNPFDWPHDLSSGILGSGGYVVCPARMVAFFILYRAEKLTAPVIRLLVKHPKPLLAACAWHAYCRGRTTPESIDFPLRVIASITDSFAMTAVINGLKKPDNYLSELLKALYQRHLLEQFPWSLESIKHIDILARYFDVENVQMWRKDIVNVKRNFHAIVFAVTEQTNFSLWLNCVESLVKLVGDKASTDIYAVFQHQDPIGIIAKLDEKTARHRLNVLSANLRDDFDDEICEAFLLAIVTLIPWENIVCIADFTDLGLPIRLNTQKVNKLIAFIYQGKYSVGENAIVLALLWVNHLGTSPVYDEPHIDANPMAAVTVLAQSLERLPDRTAIHKLTLSILTELEILFFSEKIQQTSPSRYPPNSLMHSALTHFGGKRPAAVATEPTPSIQPISPAKQRR